MRPRAMIRRPLPVRAVRRGGGGVVRVLRGQDRVARGAIAAFLWAMVLGPALHLIDHRDDHVHGAGGARGHGPVHEGVLGHDNVHVHGSENVHVHESEDVHENDGARGADRRAGDGADDPSAPVRGPHGDGQALHFGLAFLGGATPMVLPAPEVNAPLGVRAPHASVRPRALSAAHRPRGPPGLAPLG